MEDGLRVGRINLGEFNRCSPCDAIVIRIGTNKILGILILASRIQHQCCAAGSIYTWENGCFRYTCFCRGGHTAISKRINNRILANRPSQSGIFGIQYIGAE